MDALYKALFLIALATGLRASQLGAVTEHNWTTFATRFSSVSLVPAPTNLTKNESEDYRLQPVLIPAWIESRQHHKLCSVLALHQHQYMKLTSQANKDHLWARSTKEVRDVLLITHPQKVYWCRWSGKTFEGTGSLLGGGQTSLSEDTLHRQSPVCWPMEFAVVLHRKIPSP